MLHCLLLIAALPLQSTSLAVGDTTPPLPRAVTTPVAPDSSAGRERITMPPIVPAVIDARLIPTDTPQTRPRAIEYSDWYGTRLTIHRIGSFTMLPLFAAEYALGQNLLNDTAPADWMRASHSAVAGGIGVLFGINTITGAWNWWDAREDPSGRTRRTVHSAIMLLSDAGFLATAALAGGEDDGSFERGGSRSSAQRHKSVALGSIGVATVGTVMMWLWKE